MAQLKSTTVNGSLTVTGDFTAYNIFVDGNDIVDFAPCRAFTEKAYGIPYVIDGDTLKPATRYAQKNLVGISSDNYGAGIGDKSGIPISIGGFVLAHTDKVYPTGTPLTSSKEGLLTKMGLITKVLFPERLLAVFYAPEGERNWVMVRY